MEIVPVADLMRQLVLALGAALLIGNLAVVVRERRRSDDGDPDRRPNMKLVALNVALGTLLTVWAVGSILAAR